MAQSKPLFSFAGIKVFVPANSVIGLALVAWFAIPTAQEVSPGASEAAILAFALLHAIALYFSILIHELGHALSALRRKYAVDGVTLTIIGGHTTVQTNYRRPRDQAVIALAGPLATLLVGLVAWLIAASTEGLAHSVASWLAWSSVIIGAVNLLPGIPLDGGAIVDALVWRVSGKRMLGRRIAALSGLGVALLWATSPWLVGWYFGREVQTADVLISGVVGLWMASTAWRVFVWSGRPEEDVEEFQTSKPETKVSNSEPVPSSVEPIAILPFVRRAILVPLDTPVACALDEASKASAGAVVVGSNNSIVGIVRDAAVALLTDDQKVRTSVASVARRITADDSINVAASLDTISEQLSILSSDEWLVIDDAGAIVGVLVRSDIQRNIHV